MSAYVGVKDYTIPSEYQEVKYIQSDGIGYFDTGSGVTANTKITADFQFVKINYGFQCTIFGVYNNTGRISANIVATTGEFGGQGAVFSQTSNLHAKTTVVATPLSGYTSTNKHVYIFAQNETFTNSDIPDGKYGICKLYSLKIYESSTLTKNFIPVVRKNDGIAGLYETVNNIFYTPIYDIPNEYQLVDYIESTENQYIDTNYTPIADTGIYTIFNIDNEIGNSGDLGAVFGVDAGGGTRYILETYTNKEDSQGSFWLGSSWNGVNPMIVRDTKMTIGHSTVTNTVVRNDETYIISATTPVISKNIYLFGYQGENDEAASLSNTKLYYFTIIEKYTPVHEYIPVIRKSDNKPGLYDTISQNFLTNSGENEFLYENSAHNLPYGNNSENGVAKRIKNIYAGNNSNVAKKIKKSYIGNSNGVAKLFFPYYIKLEYIESTGTQYIDTGVTLSTDNLAIEAKIWLTSNSYSSYDGYIIGCYGGSSQRFSSVIKQTGDNNKNKVRMSIGSGYWTSSSAASTSKAIVHKLDMKNLKCYYDGTSRSASSGSYSKGTNASSKIGILCGSTATGSFAYSKVKGKLYYCKIWQNDTLIRDFYPCKRINDGAIGLYDSVNKVFYNNAGTGLFTPGPEIGTIS